jgi:hypothetical protein
MIGIFWRIAHRLHTSSKWTCSPVWSWSTVAATECMTNIIANRLCWAVNANNLIPSGLECGNTELLLPVWSLNMWRIESSEIVIPPSPASKYASFHIFRVTREQEDRLGNRLSKGRRSTEQWRKASTLLVRPLTLCQTSTPILISIPVSHSHNSSNDRTSGTLFQPSRIAMRLQLV